MKREILLIILSAFTFGADAQLLDSIYKNQRKGISFNQQSIHQERFYSSVYAKQNNIPFPKNRQGLDDLNKDYNVNGLFFTYRYNTTEKLGKFVKFENRRVSDYLTWVFLEHFANEPIGGRAAITKNGIVSSGYFGELYYGRNFLVNKDKSLVLSAGAVIGDLKLPDTYFGIGGYHLIGGTFLSMDWVVGKNIVWRINPSWSREFAYFNGSMKDTKRFSAVDVETELVHRNGWYFGYEHIRYDGRSERRSLIIGYRFNKIGKNS